MNAPGASALSAAIMRYLELKTALGRRYAIERRVLQTLAAFIQTLPKPWRELTAASFAAWAQTLRRLTATVRRNHLRIVRNLSHRAQSVPLSAPHRA